MSEVHAQVIAMLVEERGLAPEQIEPASRLREDLGMDGDDAVEFFNALEARFGTDFTDLHAAWSEHFGPEGMSCWNAVVVLPAAILGGLVAGVLNLSVVWGLAIAILLLALWLSAMRLWGPPDRMVPITVEEVVSAVAAGAWRPEIS